MTNSPPKPVFSVVIATYNRLNFLEQAVNSIFAQTFEDYELIIVDDGSTDNTRDYLNSLSGRLKPLYQPNKGPSAARNLGVKSAIGNYIAFLDSDDVWLPWTLATFHELIVKYREPSLLCGAVAIFD